MEYFNKTRMEFLAFTELELVSPCKIMFLVIMSDVYMQL